LSHTLRSNIALTSPSGHKGHNIEKYGFMAAKEVLRNHWPTVTIAVTAATIALAAVIMLSNMPPRVIVMATGPKGGTYYELGKRYRAELAKAGVEVRLVSTAGSQENTSTIAVSALIRAGSADGPT
jgi:hypothetical protein